MKNLHTKSLFLKQAILQKLSFSFIFLVCLLCTMSHAQSRTADSDVQLHHPWHTLLSQHVTSIDNGNSSAVDYQGFKENRASLNAYLTQLSQISEQTFDAWPNTTQLAFLINAYNAWTVEFILTEYPSISSIKELGSFFRSPWNKTFIPLLGKTRSLNDIEHELIRGSDRYNDPRIHFAVNCASIGCPALREEAYTGAKLEQQLSEQTQRFLRDKSRNYVKNNSLYLSSIFKWYREDFEKSFRGSQSTQQFLSLYAPSLTLTAPQKTALKEQKMTIKYLDYNWKLNAIN